MRGGVTLERGVAAMQGGLLRARKAMLTIADGAILRKGTANMGGLVSTDDSTVRISGTYMSDGLSLGDEAFGGCLASHADREFQLFAGSSVQRCLAMPLDSTRSLDQTKVNELDTDTILVPSFASVPIAGVRAPLLRLAPADDILLGASAWRHWERMHGQSSMLSLASIGVWPECVAEPFGFGGDTLENGMLAVVDRAQSVWLHN